ncbi:MAG TPA: hypothetical protein VER03_02305, partial [Bryobacteraceae bacterium]|nr:hypothetical protein [Bryobacteraceae bacterium]
QDAALGAWSSDGTSAALWSRAGVLQVWTGLPASPTLSFSQTAEAAAGIALADGGASALVWSDTGLLAVDANGIRALHTEPVSAAAYRAGSSDWAAVTPTQLLRSTVEPRPLTVSGPGAVAFSQEAVLVAGKGAVEVIGESSASVPCECDGTSLEPLAGTNIFRLTDLQAPSLAVYDGSEAEPRILYIPSEGRRQ